MSEVKKQKATSSDTCDSEMETDKWRAKATFSMTVPNFSNLEGPVRSPPCYVRNLPWRIQVEPREEDDEDYKKSLGFFLECNAKNKSSSWSCFAMAQLRLLSHKPNGEPFTINFDHMHKFCVKEHDWGYPYFIEWNTVLDPDNGYIKDNSITVEVKIIAKHPKGVPSKPKKHKGCDDWRVQCGGVKQRESHLLKSQAWSDCCFLVGESPNQATIEAHKLILAMASPVFEVMFYGSLAESNDPISIPDITPGTFNKMLEYIYTDNVILDTIENAIRLYLSAQKYLLTHLLAVCSKYLTCNITTDVVCTIYEFAKMVNDESLITECKLIIGIDTLEVLNHKSFEEASLETVEQIFKMNSLNITNELDLFEAAERYAKALNSKLTANPSDETRQIDDSTQNENPPDNVENVIQGKEDKHKEVGKINEGKTTNCVVLEHNSQTFSSKEQAQEVDTRCKTQMRRIVRHIRFLTLTPSQLIGYPTLTTLLTDLEILALVLNAGGNDQRPMPSDFSLSYESRCKWH